MRRSARSLLALCVPIALGCASARGADTIEPPRLVVVISVDQLTPPALARVAPHLSGGLARLLREGRSFERADLAYALTETGPGHVTLGTGCWPRTHGVVANIWWSHAEQALQYCVQDPAAALVTDASSVTLAPGRGRSPRNLDAPALAEIVRAAAPGSRSVSIAAKDRAAIGMGGRSEVVLWWNSQTARFVSSSSYCKALPDWVTRWNGAWSAELADGPFRDGWTDERVSAVDGDLGLVDDRPGEGGRVFPYPLPVLSDPPGEQELAALGGFVYGSALADHLVVDLALDALDALELGADGTPDVLTLGLSANDVVGHGCGPGSRENIDLLLRMDEELARLFARLDERVGAGRWACVLSADHGVLPLPETLAAAGEESRRVSAAEVWPALATAKGAVQERFGTTLGLEGDGRGVHLSREEAELHGVDLFEARAEIAEVLAAEGEAWIERTFTWDQLADPASLAAVDDPLLVLSARSFHPDRTPDVAIVVRPGLLVGVPAGTSHGSPHEYDRHVPLVFLGRGVVAGSVARPVRTIDVLPTLVALLGISSTSAFDGEPLPLR